MSFALLLPALFFGLWIAASVCDLKTGEIPDALPAAIALLGGARILTEQVTERPEAALSGLFGAVTGGGILFLLSKLSGGGVGGGDIKLVAASGLYLGGYGALLGLAAGSVLGAIFLLPLLLRGRVTVKSVVPFTPFLGGGMILSALFAERIFQLFVL